MKNFYETLERKIYWAERRYRQAQKDLWLYTTAYEQIKGKKLEKKVEQLVLFTG
jgi:hypothetical protein